MATPTIWKDALNCAIDQCNFAILSHLDNFDLTTDAFLEDQYCKMMNNILVDEQVPQPIHGMVDMSLHRGAAKLGTKKQIINQMAELGGQIDYGCC